MTFFKNRLNSLIAVTMLTVIFWGHSGGDLLAQYNINNLNDLKKAFTAIAELQSNQEVVINITGTIKLTEDLPELNVPAGVTVNINGGTIDGDKRWQGLVINTADDTAKVHVTNTVFKDCADTVGIFLDGSVIGFGNPKSPTTVTVGENINDISAAPGFNQWQKDPDEQNKFLLETTAGGVTINGGSTVTLTGDNNYAGITLIETGAVLIADGAAFTDGKGNKLKDAFGNTIHNAIGDLSEVRIEATGKLRLNQSETIGYLSGEGDVELNGKTLIISGDEDPDQFGKGVNPATGKSVGAFDGLLDGTGELIKTGTGRLTLNGDSTGSAFTTTIYQGTVVLGDAKALGDGDVVIRNIDTGTGLKLRNVIEADTNLTGADAVLNNFSIERKGRNLDGVSQDFGAFVIGGSENIQFGSNDIAEGGRISGGDLFINMNNAHNQVILANLGGDGMDFIDANLNSYGDTLIQRGTVVVYEYEITADGTKGSTLGKGNVHAVGVAGYSILSAGTDGMTIDNNLVMDFGSALTLSNEATTPPFSYTLSGNTSGRGGLIVDLQDASDSVTLTGNIGHTGATRIENGILVIEPAASRASTTLYDLSAGVGGVLKVQEGDLIANIGGDSTYSGEIIMSGGGQLTKTGTGTWVFDRAAGRIIESISVHSGALQLNKADNVDNVTLNGGRLIIADDPNVPATTANNVILKKLTANSSGTNVTILSNNTLTLKDVGGNLSNTWTGGTDAKVTFENDTTLQSNSGSSWKGTMEIAGTRILTVLAPGGLGDANNAQVTLKAGSTLVLDANSQIKQLNNVDGASTVQVNDGKNFTTGTLNDNLSGHAVTKTGMGTWTMLGDSSGSFQGDIHLNAGGIHLSGPSSNWGDGKLNVNGTDTSLIVDVGHTANKAIDKQIYLGENLNIQLNDFSKTDSPGELTLSSITGTGGINYKGGGTLIYDGAGINYSGDTTITGGTLDLQNVALGGDVNVEAGATLTGSGTNAVGNFTFGAGSRMIVDYQGGTSPFFTAGNVIIHDGATAHVITNASGSTSLLDVTLIQSPASSTRSGMFWFSNDIQGKRTVGDWVEDWVGDDLVGYDLIVSFIDFDYFVGVSTTGALNMSHYMDALGNNNSNGIGLTGIPSSLYPLDPDTSDRLLGLENAYEFDFALREIGGQINASLVTAQMQATTGMFQTVAKQLYPAGFYTEPGEEGYAVSGGTIYRGQSRRSGWSGWASGLGAFGNTKDNNARGTYGYNYNSYGMSFGIEPTSAMSPYRVGFFYAYSSTNIDTKTTIGRGKVSDHFVGAYGRFVDGLGYTSFVAGFGFDKYETDRDVTKPRDGNFNPYVGHSRADFDGWQGGLYFERGLGSMTWTQLGLQPYVGLQYLHSSTDAYDETGDNPYLLETGSSQVNSLRTNLGIRHARQIYRVKRGDLYLSGNISWMHEFLDADCTMASKWAVSHNPATFGVSGHSSGRDWAVMGAGMDWKLRQRLNVFGSYDLYANGNQMLSIGNVGARVVW